MVALQKSETVAGEFVAAPAHRPLAKNAQADAVESYLFGALCIGLVWAPFWLGSNRLIPWGINGLYFSALALALEASLLIRRRPHPISVTWIAPAAALFIVVVLWIGVQISTSIPTTLAHPIYGMASELLKAELPASISVNRTLTSLALVRLLTDAALFWVALQCCRDPGRAFRLLNAIAFTVAGYATYGLIAYATYGSGIPLFDVVDAPGFVRSTFVNRNSFATYAGLGFLAQIAVLLRMYRHEVTDRQDLRSYRLTQFIEATGRRGCLVLGAAFITLIALLATGSRGGIIATVFGIFVLIVLTVSRQRRRRTEQIEAILFVGAVILASFLFFGDIFAGRISTSGFADVSRWSIDLITMRSLLDAPFLGLGYGTFADAFPLYRDQSISPIGVWDKAHNTYLEVWQGLGIVFGTALIAALSLLIIRCFIGAIKRKQNASASIVAVAASLLVAVHSVVDFSLQIEAVTLTYMALLGAGVAQAISSRQLAAD